MSIGNKLKEMRTRLGLTQEELGDRCDLTKGYISQLENDNTSPSISTLTDILSVLGSNLSSFFGEPEEEQIVFTNNDYVIKDEEGYQITWLVENSQKNEMEPIMCEIKPHGVTDLDRPHEGEEFGYVMEGSIEVVHGNQKLVCGQGETFYFTSDKPHYLINNTDEVAKVIWISSPPNF